MTTKLHPDSTVYFSIYLLNHGYEIDEKFATEQDALDYIRSTCFESVIYKRIIHESGERTSHRVGSWSPIGGWRPNRD